MYSIVIIMFFALLAGLLTIGLAAHNQYHVHPDDTPCLQPPCHALEYFTNNSDVYFVSDTTLLFEQGDYYPIKGNFTIQNVTNVSFIGTPNTSDPTSPVSVIRCLPGHRIAFYNVTNLLIKHFKFKECGSFIPDFNKYKSGMSYIHRDYWAAIFIHSCTNVGIINTHIYNPVGYGILAFNVMGNNSIVNVTIVMGRQKKFDGKVCSYGAHLWYRSIHDNTMKSGEIIFSINNIVLLL